LIGGVCHILEGRRGRKFAVENDESIGSLFASFSRIATSDS
jgi:hypothetical protein